jgi:hypothetical protein
MRRSVAIMQQMHNVVQHRRVQNPLSKKDTLSISSMQFFSTTACNEKQSTSKRKSKIWRF